MDGGDRDAGRRSHSTPRADRSRLPARPIARVVALGGAPGRRVPSGARLKLAVLWPHFAPDRAPTGEVITRIVLELAARGHHLEVVTALPWYIHHRVEPEWRGWLMRREETEWGSIRRVHPFPVDKRSVVKRAAAFGGFSALAGLAGVGGGRADGVLAMSPPLTLGLTG